MSNQEQKVETIDDIEHKILFLDRIILTIECWRYEARCELFRTHGFQYPPTYSIPRLSTPSLTESDLNLLGQFSHDVQRSRGDSQIQQNEKSVCSSSVNQPPPQPLISFLSLKFKSTPKYNDLVERHGWLTGNTTSCQGPHCVNNPRFKLSRAAQKRFAAAYSDYSSCHKSDSDPLALPKVQSQSYSDADRSDSSVFQPLVSPDATSPIVENTAAILRNSTATSVKITPPSPGFSAFNGIRQNAHNASSTTVPTQSALPSSRNQICTNRQVQELRDELRRNMPRPTPYDQLMHQTKSIPQQQNIDDSSLTPNTTASAQHPFLSSTDLPDHSSNIFIQAAAIQAQEQLSRKKTTLNVETSHNALERRESRPRNDNDTAYASKLNFCPQTSITTPMNLGNNFLTRRQGQDHGFNVIYTTSVNQPSPNVHVTGRRRRSSSSVELIDQRPRQRLRTDLDQVTTPPLNSHGRTHFHSNDTQDERHSSRNASNQRVNPERNDVYNSAPSLIQNPSTGRRRHEAEPVSINNPLQQVRQETACDPIPRNSTQTDRTRDPSRNDRSFTSKHRPHRSESTDSETDQHSQHRRAYSGTPALISEGAQSPPQGSHARPIRRATKLQRQPGSYRTPAYRPLTPADRTALELRFCAQVAKIIGSKRCVSQAPLPRDNLPIFVRFKERFGAHKPQAEKAGGKYFASYVLGAKNEKIIMKQLTLSRR